MVGDPKQSIYRFRRADIGTFLAAKARFAPEAGGTIELTANFRTVEPIIDWVNAAFGMLMAEPSDEDTQAPSQPDYIALHAERGAPPSGPAVSVIGTDPQPTGARADVLRGRGGG